MTGLPETDPRPLILTAELEPHVQARFEALRRVHYPVERNQVPAHVSLFQQLPGRELAAVMRRLKVVCAQVPPPVVAVTGLKLRDHGAAFALRSPALEDVRAELAAGWDTLLIPQDRGGFQPHLTVQNKVTPQVAKATVAALATAFVPFETRALHIAVWRYLGGPWQALGSIAFRRR